MTDLEVILEQAVQEIHATDNLKNLDHYRVHYLGKKGKLTECLKGLGQLPPEERPAAGQRVNVVKEKIQELIEQRSALLQQQEITKQLAAESIDITLPGRQQDTGTFHPVTKTRERITELFSQMGFTTMDGPEVEDDYHNFEALNIPAIHPARAMQDTFYFPDNTVLRTQTSSVQIRVMETTPPPFTYYRNGTCISTGF